MRGAPTSILGLVVGEWKTDLNDHDRQVLAPPSPEEGESTIDWEGDPPQVKAPQTLPLRNTGASATEKITPTLVIPRTTRTKRQGTGNPEESIAKKGMKIYPFLGGVKKLTRSQDASAITLIAKEDACLLT